MTRLSINLNKVALIRNARGSDLPNLLKVAMDCERMGAQGITVHPRPDERHVRFDDLPVLADAVTTEFNVEGYPGDRFLKAVKEVVPHQVTLVPDLPGAITSDQGWDTIRHRDLLVEVIGELKAAGIRVSLFVDPSEQYVEGAATVGADRIELYTGPYALNYPGNPSKAVEEYVFAAEFAHQLDLGVNAGHDLNLDNLAFLKQHIPHLAEVSIGHALIVDALYYGLENTIQMYLARLR